LRPERALARRRRFARVLDPDARSARIAPLARARLAQAEQRH
jgi:hypothetical protein